MPPQGGDRAERQDTGARTPSEPESPAVHTGAPVAHQVRVVPQPVWTCPLVLSSSSHVEAVAVSPVLLAAPGDNRIASAACHPRETSFPVGLVPTPHHTSSCWNAHVAFHSEGNVFITSRRKALSPTRLATVPPRREFPGGRAPAVRRGSSVSHTFFHSPRVLTQASGGRAHPLCTRGDQGSRGVAEPSSVGGGAHAHTRPGPLARAASSPPSNSRREEGPPAVFAAWPGGKLYPDGSLTRDVLPKEGVLRA